MDDSEDSNDEGSGDAACMTRGDKGLVPAAPPGGPPDLAHKFRGALIGAAVGDALGARFEGAGSVEPAELERLEQSPGPLRYTDDTHMTLGMAQSLVESRGFDGARMAALFAQNFTDEPWRVYGPGPPRVFRLLKQGAPWDQAGRTLFGGSGSFGNGAAMRVAPAALLAFRDIDRVASLARKTAIITHAHELGIEGAVVQACAVALALRQNPATDVREQPFLDELDARAHSPIFQQKLHHTRWLLAAVGPTGRDEVVARLGRRIEAFESVPTAIYAFLRSPASFVNVVTYAISLGGDTDTIASMAGALAGAYLGVEAVPVNWRAGVEDSARLIELADSLLSLAGSG